jgi:glutaredoxin 2
MANLNKVVSQLQKASKMHLAQSKVIERHIKDMKNSPAEKKDDISIDPKNQGKFTRWVKKNMPGKSTCAAASAVMKNKKKYKPAVVKMANYANNFGCSKKK